MHPAKETENSLRMNGIYRLIRKWNNLPKQKWSKRFGSLTSTRGSFRLWDVKLLLGDCITYITDESKPLNDEMDVPQGLVFFEYQDTPDKNIALTAVRAEMKNLFENLSSYNDSIQSDFVRIYKKEGKCFWPDFDNKTITNHKFQHKFEENNCYLPLNTDFMMNWLDSNGFASIQHIFMHHYERIVDKLYTAQDTKIYSIDEIKQHINQHSTVQFLKYDEGVGIKAHIDNILRSDATVITIGIGRDVVYDFSPILHTEHKFKGKVIRAILPEASAVLLNGDVRYHWTHAIPYGVPETKYTIIWKLYHTKQLIDGHMETRKFSSMLACPMFSLQGMSTQQ